MTKRPLLLSALMVGYATTVLLWPVLAVADEPVVLPPPDQAPIIVQIQTGTPASAAEEFIKIYNPSGHAVDLSRWQLQIANATATDWQTPHRTISLSGELAPSGFLVAASRYVKDGVEVLYLPEATVRFSAGLSAAAGGARLVYDVYRLQPDGVCATAEAIADEMHWSNVPPESSWQRPLGADGKYQNTTTLLADACELPEPAPVAPPSPDSAAVESAPLAPTPVLPSADQGLLAPQLSELLPNPAAPVTDAEGEFVELYNPNDAVFDLSGFELRTGLNGTYHYKFPAGTVLPPKQFVNFLSKDTRLVLSNTASKAVLLDPFGTVIAESAPYDKAAPGQAWVYADGAWHWTAQPSAGAINTIAAVPPPAPRTASAKTTKAAATKATAKAVKSVTSAKSTKAKPKATAPAEAPKTAVAAASSSSPANPLHPGVLAVAAILAVLYGAYEYRQDVANKFHQFRTNRAARRTAGQSVKGR